MMEEEKKEEMPEIPGEVGEALAKAIDEVTGEEFRPMVEKKPEEEKVERIPKEFQFILDVPLEVSVELGRTRVLVQDLLQLTQGATIELDKTEGEPVDILINGKPVARGEVVIIEDKFGVRIIDIISPIERLKKLGK